MGKVIDYSRAGSSGPRVGASARSDASELLKFLSSTLLAAAAAIGGEADTSQADAMRSAADRFETSVVPPASWLVSDVSRQSLVLGWALGVVGAGELQPVSGDTVASRLATTLRELASGDIDRDALMDMTATFKKIAETVLNEGVSQREQGWLSE